MTPCGSGSLFDCHGISPQGTAKVHLWRAWYSEFLEAKHCPQTCHQSAPTRPSEDPPPGGPGDREVLQPWTDESPEFRPPCVGCGPRAVVGKWFSSHSTQIYVQDFTQMTAQQSSLRNFAQIVLSGNSNRSKVKTLGRSRSTMNLYFETKTLLLSSQNFGMNKPRCLRSSHSCFKEVRDISRSHQRCELQPGEEKLISFTLKLDIMFQKLQYFKQSGAVFTSHHGRNCASVLAFDSRQSPFSLARISRKEATPVLTTSSKCPSGYKRHSKKNLPVSSNAFKQMF